MTSAPTLIAGNRIGGDLVRNKTVVTIPSGLSPHLIWAGATVLAITIVAGTLAFMKMLSVAETLLAILISAIVAAFANAPSTHVRRRPKTLRGVTAVIASFGVFLAMRTIERRPPLAQDEASPSSARVTETFVPAYPFLKAEAGQAVPEMQVPENQGDNFLVLKGLPLVLGFAQGRRKGALDDDPEAWANAHWTQLEACVPPEVQGIQFDVTIEAGFLNEEGRGLDTNPDIAYSIQGTRFEPANAKNRGGWRQLAQAAADCVLALFVAHSLPHFSLREPSQHERRIEAKLDALFGTRNPNVRYEQQRQVSGDIWERRMTAEWREYTLQEIQKLTPVTFSRRVLRLSFGELPEIDAKAENMKHSHRARHTVSK